MYAILIVDSLTEKAQVLPTLAADDMAATILMLTHAECWCEKQEVNLGFTVNQVDALNQVTITCGSTVVLSITAQPIDSVVESMDIMSWIGPRIT